MIFNGRSSFSLEGLRVQDVLELLHPFGGELHVCSEVTVEETEHMTIKGQADGHPSFITLKKMQASVRGETRVLRKDKQGFSF